MADCIAKLKVKDEFSPVLQGIGDEMREVKALLAKINGHLETMAKTLSANVGQMIEVVSDEEEPLT